MSAARLPQDRELDASACMLHGIGARGRDGMGARSPATIGAQAAASDSIVTTSPRNECG